MSHAIYRGMSKITRKSRVGRPPKDSKLGGLVHVRLPDDLRDEFDKIIESRRDAPNLSSLIREAMAEYVERHRPQESG